MESSLVTALASLFGAQVFPDTVAYGASTPYCVYQQVGGRPIQYLSGGSGAGLARIQISVWSTTREATTTLMRQVEQLVAGSPLYASIEGGAASLYEEKQKLYGSRQDFMFSY